MGIQVECPNGHIFKVKDKYAGKKGLCPHCEGQVIVQVPDALTATRDERRTAARSDPAPAGRPASSCRSSSSSGSHVFDDPTETAASGQAAARAAACWARA